MSGHDWDQSVRLSVVSLPISIPLMIWLKPPWWAQLSLHFAVTLLVRAAYL